MIKRTKDIAAACRRAVKLDGNICLMCGRYGSDASHLLKRNSPYPRNDPTDYRLICCMCRECHLAFEIKSPDGRLVAFKRLAAIKSQCGDLKNKIFLFTDRMCWLIDMSVLGEIPESKHYPGR